MRIFARSIGPILIGIAIGLFVWLVPVSSRLLLRGHGTYATVLQIDPFLQLKLRRKVRFQFRTSKGLFTGAGTTLQDGNPGSQISIVYLPEDPTTAVPFDDPSTSLWIAIIGSVIAGSLIIPGSQGLYRKWDLRRRHELAIEHERAELLEL